MPTRISSLDDGYEAGQLSVFPEALDDKEDLYEAHNNAESVLTQSLTYNGRNIVVEDATGFPQTGIVRLGQRANSYPSPELIYYGSRSDNVFTDLVRGFAGSTTGAWPSHNTYVSNSVVAEHHNASKDAIINIENDLGLEKFPDEDSLNGILQALEIKYLAPKPSYRAYPLKGPPPMDVTFHSVSEGHIIRYFWDFGDGTTSTERNPFHTYTQEGIYTVRLNTISSSGAQGISIKSGYITIDENEVIPFAYTTATTGTTADTFTFVDQTDGDIAQRHWVFGDGNSSTITDPDVHTTTHSYSTAGEYRPTLVVVFSDQTYKRAFLETITVT